MSIARGPHGSYVPGSGRGDYTGREFLARASAKEQRQEALTRTKNALHNEATVLVEAAGHRMFLVPKAAYEAVVTQIEKRMAEGVVQL